MLDRSAFPKPHNPHRVALNPQRFEISGERTEFDPVRFSLLPETRVVLLYDISGHLLKVWYVSPCLLFLISLVCVCDRAGFSFRVVKHYNARPKSSSY